MCEKTCFNCRYVTSGIGVSKCKKGYMINNKDWDITSCSEFKEPFTYDKLTRVYAVLTIALFNNKKYDTEGHCIQWYLNKPYTSVREATNEGDLDLYSNGHKIGILFYKQSDQLNYLKK